MIRTKVALVGLLLAGACGGVSTTRWENDAGGSISEITGSQEHCGWQSVSFLYIEDHRYVADPEGVFGPGQTATPFEPSIDLPDDAVFSGYRDGDRELWTDPDDDEVVYVVEGDDVERWPETHVGCE